MTSRVTQNNFTGGEVSAYVEARFDLPQRQTGLTICENFLVRPQGALVNRPGFKHVTSILTDPPGFESQGLQYHSTRLFNFEFNIIESFVIEFSHYSNVLLVRCFKNGSDLTFTDTYDIGISGINLFDFQYVQDADVMTFVHPELAPFTLSRFADSNWVKSDVNFDPPIDAPSVVGADIQIQSATVSSDGEVVLTCSVFTAAANNASNTGVIAFPDDAFPEDPDPNDNTDGITYLGDVLNGNEFEYTKQNNPTHTITLQNVTFVNLAGNSYNATNLFTVTLATATPVGSGAGSFAKTYYYRVSAVNQDGVESLPSDVISKKTKSLSSTAGLRVEWQSSPDASYYRVYKNISSGTGVYGWIGDSDTLTFEDYNLAPVTSDAPLIDDNPFENGNHPSTIAYYQQRQFYGNALNNPDTLYASQTGIYDSLRYSSPTRDTDSIQFDIKDRQVNEIRHILALSSLIVLTSSGEWRVTDGNDRVMTPSSIGVRSQSFHGSSKVTPVYVDDSAIYIQEKGQRVRDIKAGSYQDAISESRDLSIMAEHLFEGRRIVDIQYCKEPYSVVYFVRDDGLLLGLTYHREYQILAWHKHRTHGNVVSITSLKENDQDSLYAVIETFNGSTTSRHIEKLSFRDDSSVTSSVFLDGHTRFKSNFGDEYDDNSTLTGLTNLAGRSDVTVVAGDEVHSDLFVTLSGELDLSFLDSSHTIVDVGVPYVSVAELPPVASSEVIDNPRMYNKNTVKVDVQLLRTKGGRTGYSTYMLPFSDEQDPDSDEYKLNDGLKTYIGRVEVDSRWTRDEPFRIEQDKPHPMTILSVTRILDAARD